MTTDFFTRDPLDSVSVSPACLRNAEGGGYTIHDLDGRLYGRVVLADNEGRPGFSIQHMDGTEFDWCMYFQTLGQACNKLVRLACLKAYRENTDERKHLPLKARLDEASGAPAGLFRELAKALR